jgi:hypothetical protein
MMHHEWNKLRNSSSLLFRGPVMLSVSFVSNFFIQFRSWWRLKSAQTLKASHFLISPNKSRGTLFCLQDQDVMQ